MASSPGEDPNQRTDEPTDDPVPSETRQLADSIIDAGFYVHRKLGPGFRESTYREALVHTLRKRGFSVEKEAPLLVPFDEILLQGGRSDLIVSEKVIVELKTAEFLHPVHERQVISYLKATGFDVGLLFNFNVVLFKSGWQSYDHPRFRSTS